MNIIEKRLKIARQKLVLFQFIIEGYSRMAIVSILDPEAAIVKIMIMPHYEQEIRNLLDTLKNELDFEWL